MIQSALLLLLLLFSSSFSFSSSSSSAWSWLITVAHSLSGGGGVTGERSAVDGGVRAACKPFSAASLMHFAMAAQERRSVPGFFGRRHDAGVGSRWGRWPGFSKASRLDTFFCENHRILQTLPAPPPPPQAEDSSPGRRQTHSTCSGSSVTGWPSLDAAPASLDDLLLESRVVCCGGDAQLLSLKSHRLSVSGRARGRHWPPSEADVANAMPKKKKQNVE